MALIDLINEYYKSGIMALFLCGAIIQVTPIKFNPYTWLARKIGKAVNYEVIEKVNNLDQRLDEHIRLSEEEKIRNARQRILIFDAECCKGEKHTLEQFNEILDDIDTYEKYCDSHRDYKNSKAVSAIKTIKIQYEQDKLNSNFL